MSGLRCPRCGGKTRVVRTTPTGGAVHRLRQCRVPECPGQFITSERPEGERTSARLAAETRTYARALQNLADSMLHDLESIERTGG